MKTDTPIDSYATFFTALSDPTRLRILNIIGNDEICVNDLVLALGESQPKISRHLAYLRGAEIVSTKKAGKWVNYFINWEGLGECVAILDALFEIMQIDSTSNADEVTKMSVKTIPQANSFREELEIFLL